MKKLIFDYLELSLLIIFNSFEKNINIPQNLMLDLISNLNKGMYIINLNYNKKLSL
jgi:hypothetical protein